MKVKYIINEQNGNLSTDYSFTGLWYVEDYYPYSGPFNTEIDKRLWLQVKIDDFIAFKSDNQFKEISVCENKAHLHEYIWEK